VGAPGSYSDRESAGVDRKATDRSVGEVSSNLPAPDLHDLALRAEDKFAKVLKAYELMRVQRSILTHWMRSIHLR
jgi:hypothetical protein